MAMAHDRLARDVLGDDRIKVNSIIGRPVMSNRSAMPPVIDQCVISVDMTSLGRLEKKLQGGIDWLQASEIMRVLEANLTEPLPPLLQDHLAARLRGEAKKKRGPKPKDRRTRDQLLCIKYYRYHRWLTRRRKTVGLVGWRGIRDAEWWQGPPAERAARMAQHCFTPMLTWKQVQEIAQRVEWEIGHHPPRRRRKTVRPKMSKTSRT